MRALDVFGRRVAAAQVRRRARREVARLAGAAPAEFLGGGSFDDLARRTKPRWPSAPDSGGDVAAHLPACAAAVVAEANLALTGRLRLFGRHHDVRREGGPDGDIRLDWNFHPSGGAYDVFRGDPKWPWEVARLAVLPRLALAHVITGRGRYARAAAAIIRDWASRPVGEGLHFSSALEVGVRLIALCQAFHFFRSSEAFRGETLATLVRRIALEAAWLQGHRSTERLVAGNHLLGELAGLVVVDLVFPEFGEDDRRDDNLARFGRALSEQVAPDGVSREQSATYGRFVADFVAVVMSAAAHAGHPLPDGLSDRAAALAGWLAALTRPTGRLPLLGDVDGGRGVDWAESGPFEDARGVILALAVLTGRAEPAVAVATTTPGQVPGTTPEPVPGTTPPRYPPGAEVVWWYAGAEGLARLDNLLAAQTARSVNETVPSVAETVSSATHHFPEGGYAVIRTGDADPATADHLVVRCGPFGHGLPKPSVHSHADFMAPALTLGGHELLVDAGNFGYTTAGELRDAFRTEDAHNTLAFEGAPMAVPGDTFRWNVIPPPGELTVENPDADTVRVTGRWRTTGGSARSVAARRVIDYNRSRSRVEIRDDWRAGGTPPATVVQRWHVPVGAGVSAHADGTGFRVRTAGGADFLFEVRPGGTIEVERGPMSSGYGHREDAPMVTVTRAGSASGTVTTTITRTGGSGGRTEHHPGETNQ